MKSIIRLIRSGACDFIRKGDDNQELIGAIERALALEPAINVNIMNATPLINKLSEEAEGLRRALTQALEQIRQLERKEHQLVDQMHTREALSNVTIRLLYLLAATGITVLFYYLKILTTTQSLLLLPLLIFVLMLFPIERIKSLTAKHREIEARIDVESENREKSGMSTL